ncbi:hypothetical protein AOR11_24185 [Vibrio alginolyticus]|nr:MULTISPECIES: hypothetical protein [Vibrio]MDW1956336.1 hypothetical protein [Vibrio sp. Vb0562]MDW2062402.1 hypothetical protein [Vibrio sp. Vb1076]EHH2571018.1 hypothetical protein [Vibrio parahaemolyticus]EKA5858977.1 hypothetical protein [Vibrio alginolyticus]ELK9270513.1 hypothetical protein [Vibrio alginolyticus]
MKINGIQYYWIVASGLVLHIVLTLVAVVFNDQIDSPDSVTFAIYLIVCAPAVVCYYTVVLEMWSVFRFKLILVSFFLLLLAFIVNPYFSLLLAFAPHIYWFWRINGVKGKYT